MAAALLRCTGIAVAAARSMSNHSGKRKPCPHNLMNSYLHTEFGSLLGSLAPKRDPCGVVRFLGSLWDSNSVPQEATEPQHYELQQSSRSARLEIDDLFESKTPQHPSGVAKTSVPGHVPESSKQRGRPPEGVNELEDKEAPTRTGNVITSEDSSNGGLASKGKASRHSLLSPDQKEELMDIMESVMAGIADAPNEFSPQPYEPERGKSVLRNAEDREGREYLQCTPMFAETSTLSSYSESQLLGASQQGRASKDVEAGRAASPSAGGGGSSKPPASTMKEADKSWREEMQRFWAEVGVVEPLTVETLLRLAAKYERINNTAKLRNRLVHLQRVLPSDVSAVELLSKVPQVVLVSPHSLQCHLQYVSGLLPGQDLATLLRRAPFIVSTSTNAIKVNIQELGKILQDLNTCDLLCREPRLLAADQHRAYEKGQFQSSMQMIKEIMREATGFEDDAGLTVAFKDAILAHPRLLLLRSEILRYRWRMLGHTAAMHGPWREEIRQFRQDPVAIALLLSRSRQTMKRLDFVVQHGIGYELSLQLILTMEQPSFNRHFPAFQGWLVSSSRLEAPFKARLGQEAPAKAVGDATGYAPRAGAGAASAPAAHLNGFAHSH